jgi:hypothetical protein
VNDTVLQLMRDRMRQGSTPGQRSDDARLVLLIEGGSSRGAYSSGMTVAIERLGLLPTFDAVYGSSMGALNAAVDTGRQAAWNELASAAGPLFGDRDSPHLTA